MVVGHVLTRRTVYTSCPDELPFANGESGSRIPGLSLSSFLLTPTDKYALRQHRRELEVPKDSLVVINMSEGFESFVLWLYATTLIRDGIAGNFLSEESLYFYKMALHSMQKAVDEADGVYSESLIRALACFSACAVRTSHSLFF